MKTDNPYLPNFIENPTEQLFNSIVNWGNTTPNAQAMPTPMPAAVPTASPMQGSGYVPTFWDKMFGYQDGNIQYGAMAPTLLQGAGGLAQSWLGMQQLDQAKEQFAFEKDAFQKQYNNQVQLTNANLRDRQSARVAAAPGAYQSVGDYMNQNKVG